jgi:hypothetical protein
MHQIWRKRCMNAGQALGYRFGMNRHGLDRLMLKPMSVIYAGHTSGELYVHASPSPRCKPGHSTPEEPDGGGEGDGREGGLVAMKPGHGRIRRIAAIDQAVSACRKFERSRDRGQAERTVFMSQVGQLRSPCDVAGGVEGVGFRTGGFSSGVR